MSREEVILKLSKLTDRQIEVLRLVCEGLTYKLVGKELYIEENTVKSHMGNIYIKLELDSLSDSERKIVLYQEFCPALQEMDVIPEVIEDQEEPEPVPNSVMAMVVRDEKAIVPIPQAEIIDVPYKEIKNQGHPSRLRWMIFGLFLGIILTVLIGFAGWEAYQWVISQLDTVEATPQVKVAETTPVENGEAAVSESRSPTPLIPTEEDIVVVTSTQPATINEATVPPSPTVLPTVALALPFLDNFDAGLKPEWTEIFGDWRISNGRLTTISEGSSSYITVGDPGLTNYKVEVEFDDGGGSRTTPVQVIMRYQDIDNFVVFQLGLNDSTWFLKKDGKWLELANGKGLYWHQPSNRRAHIRVEANGEFYTAYVDNELWLSINDDSFVSGLAGLSTFCDYFCPTFDNFSISELNE